MSSIVIVGGGIVGVATAFYLSQHHRSITLIEPELIGGATTAASMGHLTVLDGSDDEFALSQRSLQLWSTLRTQLPIDVAYQTCGTIWLATDEDEMREAQRKAQYYRDRNWAAQCIDAQQLRELEPHVASDLCGGLWVPNDAIVYPPLAAHFLFEQARLSGVQRIHDRVIEILDHEVVTTTQRIRADVIIVCAGNESRVLLPAIPLRAKKGQLAITERGSALVHHQLIELGYIKNAHASEGDSVAANIQPRPTQQLLIGSSRQFDQCDKTINWPLLRAMLKRAQRFVPALMQQNIVRVWSGVRPTTPDNLPLIGEYDRERGIWLNCGHEGLGVATALASAELISAQLCGGHSPLNTARFDPRRFDCECL